MIIVNIPLRLVNEMNRREHWAVKAKRAKHQRGITRAMVHTMMPFDDTMAIDDGADIDVTITRIGKRRMDPDGVACSCKHVQDGIADAIGIDDGSLRYTWTYRQEVAKDYAVRVEIKTIPQLSFGDK